MLKRPSKLQWVMVAALLVTGYLAHMASTSCHNSIRLTNLLRSIGLVFGMYGYTNKQRDIHSFIHTYIVDKFIHKYVDVVPKR
jgi:hypothetical protein